MPTTKVCHRCGKTACQCGKNRKRKANSYGYRWQRLSRLIRQQSPLCELCLQEEKIRAAAAVVHKQPAEDTSAAFWDEENLMPVCRQHQRTHTGGRSFLRGVPQN